MNSNSVTPPSSPAISDQYAGLAPSGGRSHSHVDNRCCFCLTLRTGAILTGILNGLANVAAFTVYVTNPKVQSSWGHPGEAVTNLDISYLVVFTLQIVCDAILVWGALKKIPNHLVPWLWANAVIIAVFLVLIALMLFFGHLKTTLDHNEFVSALAGIGVIGAIHMFSWLVVFQFRKNLMEEHRLMARLVASAPLPPDEPPARQERAPSPPPAYDEVTKPAEVSKTDNASISDVKIDFGCSESPPDYELAMAMSRADYLVYENTTQTTIVEMEKAEDASN